MFKLRKREAWCQKRTRPGPNPISFSHLRDEKAILMIEYCILHSSFNHNVIKSVSFESWIEWDKAETWSSWRGMEGITQNYKKCNFFMTFDMRHRPPSSNGTLFIHYLPYFFVLQMNLTYMKRILHWVPVKNIILSPGKSHEKFPFFCDPLP